MAREYVKSFDNMSGRGPGNTTITSIGILQHDIKMWNKIPFKANAGGCGGSMRAACIGLCYYGDIDQLIAVSIESGRITHHNPIGFLGAMSAAMFTSFAIQNYKIETWPFLLLHYKGRIADYLRNSGREVDKNLKGG